MFPGHRSMWRRRARRDRAARIALTLAIPAVLALVIGVVVASSGGKSANLTAAAAGDCATPSASAPAATASGALAAAPAATASGTLSAAPAATASGTLSAAAAAPSGSASGTLTSAPPASASAGTAAAASPTPCAATSATAAASASASTSAGPMVPVRPSSFANGPMAFFQLGDVATNPVDGQGNAINLNQNADQAAASGNCTLVVPANPLTAQGLATPYQLGDGCSEANPNEAAFAEATILSPGGQLQVYNPLVITQGTTPAAAPVVPTIPRGSTVILDFGFNGTNLVLTGPGAMQRSSNCVDALGQSVIGQVSACNAVNFYRRASFMLGGSGFGGLGFGGSGFGRPSFGRASAVPAAGTANDGQQCETTRDFALVDQDQSDNVNSTYLLNGNGQTAQNTAANKAALAGATTIANGSDNALLSSFVDPANGCAPFTAPDMTAPNGTSPSQALNELSASRNQQNPIALVPPNDEMVLVNGAFSVAKTNVYRSLVGQPLLQGNVNPTQVAASYCMNLVNIAPARNLLDMANDANAASPVPTVGNNLATFLGNRLSMSFTNLNCKNFGLTNPVTVTVDGNGVAIAVTYNTKQQQAMIPAADAGPGGNGFGFGFGSRRHRVGKLQNPSRM